MAGRRKSKRRKFNDLMDIAWWAHHYLTTDGRFWFRGDSVMAAAKAAMHAKNDEEILAAMERTFRSRRILVRPLWYWSHA